MKKKGIGLLVLLTAASVLLSPGCATLTRDSRQTISVTSAPRGATVFVNGRPQGATPLTLWLHRRQGHQVIRIESPGYRPVEIRPRRTPSGAAFVGNLLFGLLPAIAPAGIYSLAHDGEGVLPIWILSAAAIGALFTLFDTGTGAIYDFKPREITVVLKKADGTPRVDTVFIDAEDLRNITWVRVRRD